MHIPDPEHAGESKPEVEITDLDSLPESGKVPGRPTRRKRVSSLRLRAWMSIALVAAVALLIVTVLVSLLHMPATTKVTIPSLPTNYPVSLSVASGVCYASSSTGVVTALRVSDGAVLWHHASGKAGEGSITVVDGIIYLAPLFSAGSTALAVTIEALRAKDGAQIWSRTLPMASPSSFQFTVVNNVVYIMSGAERIDALRASDGSSLWHYTAQVLIVALPTIAGEVAYVITQDHLTALRASDGSPLWTYRSLNPLQPFSPVVTDGMIYLSLQNGGMDVLLANTGMLHWRYISSIPALDLYPQILVANGIIYALTQDRHLLALRANDGSTVWSISLHATEILPLLIVVDGVIYLETFDGGIVALHENSGSVLWSYPGGGVIPASLTAAQSMIYLDLYATGGVNSTGSIIALRASDGFVLWRYTPHVPVIQSIQLLPVTEDELVLIALQDGNINALRTSDGSLRWHRVM